MNRLLLILYGLMCALHGATASGSKSIWTTQQHRYLQEDEFAWVTDLLDNFEWIDATEVSDLWDSCAESVNNTSGTYVPVVSFYDDPVLYGESLAENRCSESEETDVTKALEDFYQCADFDLQSFLSYFPVAITGSELRCLTDDFSLSADQSLQSDEDALSETCAQLMFGWNVFGDAMRSLFLYPDRVLPCLEEFSRSVPSCNSKATSSIPVAGPWLQTTACLIGSADTIVDNFCSEELIELNQSLPETFSNNSCEDIDIGNSLLLALPKPLLGAPLPDACQRHAEQNEEDFAGVVSRYEAFQENCGPVWSGWEDDSTAPPNSTDSQASTGGATGIVYPPSSIAWAFFGGMASGLLLLPAIVLLKKKNAKVEATAAIREMNIHGRPQCNSDGDQLDDVQFA